MEEQRMLAKACRLSLSVLAGWLFSTVGVGNAQASAGSADALLAIDQHRASVVERIVATWGVPLAQSAANVSIDDLRGLLASLRADHLLAASLAGTLEGVRDVLAQTAQKRVAGNVSAGQLKSLGDKAVDDVYTPVTPCRLVDTRGSFPAVYQGNGTAAHTPAPFAPNQIRSYTLQGANGVCLSQLPAGLAPSAVQLQIFAMPTTTASGDVEILPQGDPFGSTATMVYIGSIPFNTVSTAARVNLANNQISVQVRGGGAHLAIDVVGYFKSASDASGMNLVANGERVMRFDYNATSPNVIGGNAANTAAAGNAGATIGGGGATGTQLSVGGVTTGCGTSCANRVTLDFGTIGGGAANLASNFATVGGGFNNDAQSLATTVAGGESNLAGGAGLLSGIAATVGGGRFNQASGTTSTIAGGDSNIVAQNAGAIGGGVQNLVGAASGTIAGGKTNTIAASGAAATIGGGENNIADADHATIAGGNGNHATGSGATVAGGVQNVAAGNYSGVLGGIGNSANAERSVALGTFAKVGGAGSFLFASVPGVNGFFEVTTQSPNEFAVAASGGIAMGTSFDFSNVCRLAPGGGSWSCTSDRNAKRDFAAVDVNAILDKVAALPITTWRFKAESDAITHMGPMAQDFRAAFGLGIDDKTITQVDVNGVTLAAIQGLRSLLFERDDEIRALRARLTQVEALRSELDAVKELLLRGASSPTR